MSSDKKIRKFILSELHANSSFLSFLSDFLNIIYIHILMILIILYYIPDYCTIIKIIKVKKSVEVNL